MLPPGTYQISVERDGFAAIRQTDLLVTVGATVNLRFAMEPKGVTETVEVQARQTLDSTKTNQSTLIDRTQIDELPINGRRADQFALLTPGVTRDGRFGLLSYRGQSGVFNNFTIEGNDDNQAYFSEARGRTRIASNVSANAVQEFQVAQAGFMPEFGKSAGGGINAVVRSGTNTFRGDGFWYFRNQAFNSKDPLATIKPDETTAPVRRIDRRAAGPRTACSSSSTSISSCATFRCSSRISSGVLTAGLPANPTAADVAAFNAGVKDSDRQVSRRIARAHHAADQRPDAAARQGGRGRSTRRTRCRSRTTTCAPTASPPSRRRSFSATSAGTAATTCGFRASTCA